MKKTHKKIFGFLGLMVVAVMTVFAATLPGPEALATSSATDSIVVRVLPSSPDVNITSPVNGNSFAKSQQVISFNYSQVNDVLVTMEKQMPSGSPQVYPIFSTNAGLVSGDKSISIDLSESQYGYGDYTLKISGQGQTGVTDNDVSSFSFYPVVATIEEDDSTEKVFSVIEYDDKNTDIDHFSIDVYDENGNLAFSLSPIDKGTKRVELPFAEKNLPEGRYTVSVSAFDINNVIIYKSYDRLFLYKPVKVPNTGGLFSGLNISKTDYLITGLVVFAVVGIFGVIFIVKNKDGVRK